MDLEAMKGYMALALAQGQEAFDRDEVPVGACVVKDGKVIGTGQNRRQRSGDPLAHAEVEALRAAAKTLGSWNLEGAWLFVTLEPCPMCAGAVIEAHVEQVVFGAYDGKAGCCGSLYNLPEDERFPGGARVMGGVMREACAELLRKFFLKRRQEAKIY